MFSLEILCPLLTSVLPWSQCVFINATLCIDVKADEAHILIGQMIETGTTCQKVQYLSLESLRVEFTKF